MLDHHSQLSPGRNVEHFGAYVASGLWLRLAFVGASGVAAGIALMFEGGGSWLFALGLAAGGTLVAVAAWQRALAVLDAIDTSRRDAPNAAAVDAPEKRAGPRAPTLGAVSRGVGLQAE